MLPIDQSAHQRGFLTVLRTHYRFIVLTISLLALCSLQANALAFNFAIICIQRDFNILVSSGNVGLISSAVHYNPSESSWLFSAVAIGGLLEAYCRREGIFFQAYGPFARQAPALINDPVVQRVAKAHDATPQSVILSYSVSKGVGVVPKAQQPEHLRQNYQCLFRLSEGELAEMDKIDKNVNYVDTFGWLVD